MSMDQKEQITQETGADAISPAETPKKKKSVNKWLIVIIVLLLAAIALLLIYFSRDRRYRADSRATAGFISGRTPAEIQSLLDQIVTDGMLNVSINGHITVKENREADVCIENISANKYLMQVDIITTDSAGKETKLYESGTIAPGYCIEYGKFNTLPPDGAADAVALFTALDKDTLKAVGQVKLNVQVERKGN